MFDTTIAPLPTLVASALEMAEEIKDRHNQYCTLAGTIESGLTPPEAGADSPEWTCYRLSQMLTESMSDMDQLNRLVGCLKTAKDAAATSPMDAVNLEPTRDNTVDATNRYDLICALSCDITYLDNLLSVAVKHAGGGRDATLLSLFEAVMPRMKQALERVEKLEVRA